MSQQTPQDRKLQPIPAWMLKDEEKTGGNAGAGVEETPSPAQTQEPEQTTIALPERKAFVPSPKPPDLSREEVQQSALGEDVLYGVFAGAIIGGLVGYAIEGSLVGTVVGVSISAVFGGMIALMGRFLPEDTWHFLTWLDAVGSLGDLLDCCSTFAVLVVASVVTIAGFLLWHNLLLAALAGGSIVIMMLIGLSVLYKAGSQSSSSRYTGSS